MTVLALLAGWAVLAVMVALLVGAVVALGDRHG